MYRRVTYRYTNLHHLERNPSLRKQALKEYGLRARTRAVGELVSTLASLERSGLPHTQEDVRMFSAVNTILTGECRQYGIQSVKIPQRKIALLTEHAFGEHFPKLKNKAWGCYDVVPDLMAVVSTRDRASSWTHFSVLLHEGVHWASKTIIVHDLETKRNVLVLNGHAREKINQEEILGGVLDEAITQKLTKELIFKNARMIERIAPSLKAEECFLGVSLYDRFIALLDSVLEALAQRKKVETDVVWAAFKRAHFLGGTTHLDEVDLLLGPGSQKRLTEIFWDDQGEDVETTVREVGRATAYFKGKCRQLAVKNKGLVALGSGQFLFSFDLGINKVFHLEKLFGALITRPLHFVVKNLLNGRWPRT